MKNKEQFKGHKMFKQTPISKDLNLSEVVYGAWRLADDCDTSTANVRSKIDACLEQNITTFDHADIYGDYQCEILFGKALAEQPSLRDQMQLVSKCGIAIPSQQYPQRGVKHYDTSAAYINMSVDNSLRNLRSEQLDLLMIHRPDPFMDVVQTAKALDALVDSGKVKTVGVSNFAAADWRVLQKHMSHKLIVNQIELSLLESNSLRDGTLADIQIDDMKAMAWSPLAGGALFGDSAAAIRLQPLLTELCHRFNCGVDHLAIAWLLAHPGGIIPVVGTNNLDRIKALSAILNVELDRETWFDLYSTANGCEVP